jgi:hypothetical protein
LLGAIAGFIGGGFTGGGMGAVAAAPSGELLSIFTVPVGAIDGAITGAKIGAAAGAALDATVHFADAGKGRGGNRVPNREVKRLYKKWGLNKAGQDYVHDQISTEEMSLEDIEDVVKEAARHNKFLENPPKK